METTGIDLDPLKLPDLYAVREDSGSLEQLWEREKQLRILLFELEDFTLRNDYMSILAKVSEAVDKGELKEDLLDIAKYGIVPTRHGYFFVDTDSKGKIELKNEELFSRLRKTVEEKFDSLELELVQGEDLDSKILKKELKEIEEDKKCWLDFKSRWGGLVKLPSNLENAKKNEEESLNEVSQRHGRPFLYISENGIAYVGDRAEAWRKISEFGRLMRALASMNDPTAISLVKRLDYIKRGVESGMIPDFNPYLLENTFKAYIDERISVREPRRPIPLKYKIAGLILILLTGGTLGLHYYYNIHLPEQRKAPYKRVGGTDEQIDQFFSKYPKQNGNETWVDFFKAWVEDQLLAEKTFNDEGTGAFKGLIHAVSYIYFVNSNGYDGLSFLQECSQFARDYQIVLPIYSKNATFPGIVYNLFMRDPQITTSRYDLALKALQQYQDLDLINKNLCLVSIYGVNNVTIANEQLGLPEFGRNDLWRLTNATQRLEGKYLLNFSPIVFKSVNSSDVYLIPIPARETWMLTELLRRINQTGFDILKNPGVYLALNGKVIANDFCLFDEAWGISYYDKNITTTDPRVWDVIMLQWEKYLSAHNDSGMIRNQDFPWTNGTKLMELYPDMNDLRVALVKVFYLPSATYSIKDGKRVYGIEGTKIDLLQSYELLQNISREYRSVVVDESKVFDYVNEHGLIGLSLEKYKSLVIVKTGNPSELYLHSRWMYWQWIADHHGLPSTKEQYAKLDQSLLKIWSSWDPVRYVIGRIRADPRIIPEVDAQYFVVPGVLRMAGFPNSRLCIDRYPPGAPGSESAVCIPTYVVIEVKKEHPSLNIYFAPANGFGMYALGDFLVEDYNIQRIWEWLGDQKVYTMKRD